MSPCVAPQRAPLPRLELKLSKGPLRLISSLNFCSSPGADHGADRHHSDRARCEMLVRARRRKRWRQLVPGSYRQFAEDARWDPSWRRARAFQGVALRLRIHPFRELCWCPKCGPGRTITIFLSVLIATSSRGKCHQTPFRPDLGASGSTTS
jgi:hypothetical protein